MVKAPLDWWVLAPPCATNHAGAWCWTSSSCCGQTDRSRWARRGDFLPMLRRAECWRTWKWKCEDLALVRSFRAVCRFSLWRAKYFSSKVSNWDNWRSCVWCVVNTKGLITRLIRSDSTPVTPSLRNFYKNANAVFFKSVCRRATNYFRPLTKSLW